MKTVFYDKLIKKEISIIMKMILKGEDLKGKTIKYCSISNGTDGNEHNIIATDDGSIMMFDVDYEDGHFKCYNEDRFKTVVAVYDYVRKTLLNENIVTKKQVGLWEEERKMKLKRQDELINQQKYEQYLKLKEEFEK
jgi:hypothetical protein